MVMNAACCIRAEEYVCKAMLPILQEVMVRLSPDDRKDFVKRLSKVHPMFINLIDCL